MTEEIEVRTFRQGDQDEILQLLDLVFAGWPHIDLPCTSLEHWMWKNFDNPQARSVVLIAQTNGRVVGANHTVLLKIKIGEDYFIGGQATDLAVHPDFRGIGVRTKMRVSKYDYCERAGVVFYLAVSGNPIIIQSAIRRKNPIFPHPILNLVKINDIDLHLEKMPVENAWFRKLGYYVVKKMNSIRYLFTDVTHANQDVKISDISAFDDRIDDFWIEISDHYDYIVERDRGYLNWRYCDPRAGGFRVRIAERGSQVLGFSVLKINRFLEDYPVGFVVDMMSLPDKPEVVAALLLDAEDYFERNDVNIVNALIIQGHSYEKIYKKYGFLDSRIRLSVFMRGIDKAGLLKVIESCPPSKAFYSWGDHDSLPLQPPRL